MFSSLPGLFFAQASGLGCHHQVSLERSIALAALTATGLGCHHQVRAAVPEKLLSCVLSITFS